MKNLFRNLLVLLLLGSEQLYAQVGSTVIDISTGIDNNTGQLIPIGSPDDTWTICMPGSNPANPSSFVPVPCGSGILEGQNSSYPGKDNSIRWISPYLNALGEHIKNPPAGTYYYKMQLNLPFAYQSTTLNFTHIGADNVLNMIYVNTNTNPTNTYSVNYSFNPFSNNTSIVISGLVAGQNEIILRLNNDSGWTGMEIKGALTCTCAKFSLKDRAGNEKNEFCYGEEILFTGYAQSSNYKLELLPETGSTPLAIKDATFGSPNGASITKAFANYNFQINTNYRVKLITNGPCGCYEVIKDFKFICCPQSIESEFSLVYGTDPKLKGINTTPGTHLWQVYNISQYTGDITSSEVVGTSSQAEISLNTGGPCYYVKHTVTNVCGSSCASKRFCQSECDDCDLPAPSGLSVDSDNKLSWNLVPGATSYSIDIYVCDPACCGGTPDVASTQVVSVLAPGTAYTLTPADFASIGIAYVPCYAWRVFAKCPNGLRSSGSLYQCGNTSNAGMCSFGPSASLGITDRSNTAGSFSADVYPNPSQGSVTIDIQEAGDITYWISVYDNTGRLIRTFEGKGSNGSPDRWNISSLSKGIYLIQISTSDNQYIIKKLIIE